MKKSYTSACIYTDTDSIEELEKMLIRTTTNSITFYKYKGKDVTFINSELVLQNTTMTFLQDSIVITPNYKFFRVKYSYFIIKFIKKLLGLQYVDLKEEFIYTKPKMITKPIANTKQSMFKKDSEINVTNPIL